MNSDPDELQRATIRPVKDRVEDELLARQGVVGDGLGSRTLRRQIRVETDTSRSARFSNRGDSGSVVMTTDRRVVGPPISREVCDPGDLIAPLERSGQFGGGAYGDTLAGDAADFWAGYLAALEEVAATYDEGSDTDEGGADR